MTDVLTVAGLILTVLLAYLHVQKNQRAALEAQQAHLRDQLKVQLYEKVSGVFQQCAETVQKALSEVQSTVWHLESASKGLPVEHIRSASDLIESNQHAQRALTKVLLVLEQYEMAFARFGSIRRQFSDDHKQLLETHSALFAALLPFTPGQDSAGHSVPPNSAPSQDALDALAPLAREYTNTCGDILGHLIDLQVEAQNELLGHLFQRQLPPRHPQDPGQKVLVRDHLRPTERPVGRIV